MPRDLEFSVLVTSAMVLVAEGHVRSAPRQVFSDCSINTKLTFRVNSDNSL